MPHEISKSTTVLIIELGPPVTPMSNVPGSSRALRKASTVSTLWPEAEIPM